MKKVILLIFLMGVFVMGYSQTRPPKKNPTILMSDDSSLPENSTSDQIQSTPTQSGPRKDSLGFEHRDDAKDSITISYHYLDGLKRFGLDSSINDFDNYYSVPSYYQNNGNNGAAAAALIFTPTSSIGWDPGFHAFDVYKFTLEETKFYKTTKPFSSLSYQLASGKEQMLKASHTQNPRPNLNLGFDYKLINAPGFFITQNTNHNGYRLFGNFQSKKKRYNGYAVILGNKIRASENGGIEKDSDLLDPNRKDRFSVPVNLGNDAPYTTNPFATTVKTGNTYKDFCFFTRNSYDLGKKDSVAINDSTTEYLFYPKLRIQHTFIYTKNTYQFIDMAADSLIYFNWYGLHLNSQSDSFKITENWKSFSNDFSLIQFPDTKNTGQYFLGGTTLQNISGELSAGSTHFYNLLLHGEYRNRTRNKLWDVVLKGSFYINGMNEGDFNLYASINRNINKKLGNISLYFTNLNRTPSFIFDNRSAFNFDKNNLFKKENITSFGVEAKNPIFTLGFKNHLLVNYSYFKNFYQSAQYSQLINVVQVYAFKKIKLFKNIYVYSDITLQQTDLASPVRVPLFYSRNRFAYEGKLFKNLTLSAGLEARYFSPYKSYQYSPVMGQFFAQDTITIKNLPDIHAFVHFRIKGFAGYIRTENLNTLSFQNGFGFINNNFAAPHYPTPGLMIRFGIQWWYVN